MKCKTVALVLSFLVVRLASGQVVSSDRPQATVMPDVVPVGVLQIESGLGYLDERNPIPPFNVTTIGETLLRYGLLDPVELRLKWDGIISRESSPGDIESGIGDASLGAKVRLREEGAGGPGLAAVGAISLPIGSDAFTSDEVDPSLLLSASLPMETVRVVGNIGAQWLTDTENNTDAALVYSLAVQGALLSVLEAYGELSGQSGDNRDAHTLGGGVRYPLADNLLLDASVGVGLTDDAADWSVGAGVTYRMPVR